MLRELTRDDWLTAFDLDEDDVPPVLLLYGTRNLKTRYAEGVARCSDVRPIDSPNSFFEDVFLGVLDGTPIAYASVYGAPMASEVTHLFGVLGTRAVVQLGCCGALAEGMAAGDLVCATEAHCGEGAAQYYRPGLSRVPADPTLVGHVLAPDAAPVALHKGAIWTTSALLAEGPDELHAWRDAGCVAVDMETATTYAVAGAFGMRALSLLYVYDLPLGGDHLGLDQAATAERRALGSERMWAIGSAIIAREGRAARP